MLRNAGNTNICNFNIGKINILYFWMAIFKASINDQCAVLAKSAEEVHFEHKISIGKFWCPIFKEKFKGCI
mgnify:FL=1|jgi:hypothetical protein